MLDSLQAALSSSTTLTPGEILARLLLAFLLTSAVSVVYASNYSGYGRPAPMALVFVLVAMATCGIIMAIGDNLALSLGMVGALSIVRFRAAIKDNRDLAYLFWTLAVGLVCGAGGYMLAILLLLIIGPVALFLERSALFRSDHSRYIVILSQRPEGDDAPASLLPGGAILKSSVFHREDGVEENTFLVDFADNEALAAFKTKLRSEASVTGFQILGPEDTGLG